MCIYHSCAHFHIFLVFLLDYSQTGPSGLDDSGTGHFAAIFIQNVMENLDQVIAVNVTFKNLHCTNCIDVKLAWLTR